MFRVYTASQPDQIHALGFPCDFEATSVLKGAWYTVCDAKSIPTDLSTAVRVFASACMQKGETHHSYQQELLAAKLRAL